MVSSLTAVHYLPSGNIGEYFVEYSSGYFVESSGEYFVEYSGGYFVESSGEYFVEYSGECFVESSATKCSILIKFWSRSFLNPMWFSCRIEFKFVH